MKVLSHRIFENNVEHDLKNIEVITKYVKMAEIDVHLTKDNQLILNHDRLLYSKTGNLSQVINELTYDEIKINYPNKYYLLDDLFFNHLNSFDLLNIELKTYSYEYKNIEQKVVKLITKYKCQDKIILSSFNPKTLMNLNALTTKIKIGFLFDQLWIFKEYNHQTNFDYINVDYKLYLENMNYINNYVEMNHKKLILWTINDKEVFNYIQNNTKVEYIISDNYKIGVK